MCFLTVFEGVYQVTYRPFIKEGAPRGIKMRRIGKAGAASVIAPCPDKGNAADWAERRQNERQEASAGCADMERAGIRDIRMADVTDRRQNDIKQCMEKTPA
jgi:hypothetical protein